MNGLFGFIRLINHETCVFEQIHGSQADEGVILDDEHGITPSLLGMLHYGQR